MHGINNRYAPFLNQGVSPGTPAGVQAFLRQYPSYGIKGLYDIERSHSKIKTFFSYIGHKGRKARTEKLDRLTKAIAKVEQEGSQESVDALKTTSEDIRNLIHAEDKGLGNRH